MTETALYSLQSIGSTKKEEAKKGDERAGKLAPCLPIKPARSVPLDTENTSSPNANNAQSKQPLSHPRSP